MLLGEAKAKCEAIAQIPLKPSEAQQLHLLYLAKGVGGSTAIEGNTLDEEQVKKILSNELDLPPSQAYLKQEVENIAYACTELAKELVAQVGQSRLPLSPDAVREFNAQVLRDLELSEEVEPGKYGKHSVVVSGYRGAPWQDCPYLVEKLCSWLNELSQPQDLVSGILSAVLAHLYIAWIHPFGDGNGRTARLIEFFILIGAGAPTPAAHLLSNHYNLTRERYLRELARASESGGDVVPFLLYAVEGLVDQLQWQLRDVQAYQIGLAWRDYVHEVFENKISPSDLRKRDLLLDLSWLGEPVRKARIRTVSPRIEEAYRDKTDKTVTRDVNWLIQQELLIQSKDGYLANTDIIFGFKPRSSRPE